MFGRFASALDELTEKKEEIKEYDPEQDLIENDVLSTDTDSLSADSRLLDMSFRQKVMNSTTCCHSDCTNDKTRRAIVCWECYVNLRRSHGKGWKNFV
jgi:hypothetical protein